MSTTAFKNAVRRREHRERHQPAARAGLGLLEKHKDYVQRARNFHAKEARVAALRQKAANRNPDEFYTAMVHEQTRGGVASKARSWGRGGGNEARGAEGGGDRPELLNAEMLAVLKTQDAGYVRTVLAAEGSKAQRLRASLHATRAGGNRRTVFGDDGDELGADAGARGSAVAGGSSGADDGEGGSEERHESSAFVSFSASSEELEGRGGRCGLKRRREDAAAQQREPGPGGGTGSAGTVGVGVGSAGGAGGAGGAGSVGGAGGAGGEGSADSEEPSSKQRRQAAKGEKALSKARKRAYAELEEREERVRKLAALTQHMDLKRKLLSSKGRRTKVVEAQGELQPAVYKWKPQRAK